MSLPWTILVTGGAGFIGSHTCVELLDYGYEVVVVDNHANSSPEALARVQKVAGRPLAAVYTIDVRDRAALTEVFERHPVDAVIHFAAHKAVGESVELPIDYYDNNVGGTTALLAVMNAHGVHRLVFSSSCSLYGNAERIPITEQSPAAPTNPYASTKWMCEQVLTDVCRHRPDLQAFSLRYFNPVGAHPSALLGEDPLGIPSNVMPYLAQVAIGRREKISVFGDDWPTHDGTGVRDYIHVMDVAEGHRIALEHLDEVRGVRALNLATGVGTSVLELVAAFRRASGRPIPYEITARRPGDVARLIADPGEIERAWGWRATRTLDQMCGDVWRFQLDNPVGYQA
ncbi:UDP-glucose 4-epimerase GalE [Streptomyces sp. GD-15H]|uniref:UDP-glucose 4-epimerase GalE n=1 Tax=Streptomyces sp. GD-15H TaxID=3129112 RepID=UPI00324AB966